VRLSRWQYLHVLGDVKYIEDDKDAVSGSIAGAPVALSQNRDPTSNLAQNLNAFFDRFPYRPKGIVDLLCEGALQD